MRSEALRKPVQVRLPEKVRDFLTQTARERRESKSAVVIEALNCLREQQIEALMEEGYRALGDSQHDVVAAGLAAALPAIPR
jgi:Arc/MetJ-type ribon-helix-helix transcriptional regulator